MSSIVSFNFVAQSVRVVMRGDEPWFVAADVCGVLDIANSRRALDRLDDDEKGVHSMNTPGGNQELSIINESGLYSLILTSRKPEAKKFKKWVTSEVLPALRKVGRYEIPRPVAVPLLTSRHLEMLNHKACRLAHPFYMRNSTRLWFLKYAREYAGVKNVAHIPLSCFDEVMDFLDSQEKRTDHYLNDRIRNERAYLTQSLQREMDRRLGRAGPEFELVAPNN